MRTPVVSVVLAAAVAATLPGPAVPLAGGGLQAVNADGRRSTGPHRQGPSPGAVVEAARAWHRAQERRILAELLELLAIPNVASDPANLRRNAEWIVAALERRGVRAEILETGGAPYVFGELPAAVGGAGDGAPTLLFYCHYDGQEVDRGRWVEHGPWEPVIRDGRLEEGAAIVWRDGEPLPPPPAGGAFPPDWRVYARSAADDRSPIVMTLAALDALAAAGMEPPAHLKFLFEGDEESGSPNIAEMARRHRQRWAADLVVIADGPKHPSGRPTLTFGVRGIATLQITVYGPSRPLHSGHYGNWAPNPAMRLAQLLASMVDPETGTVLVEGFYDDRVPLSATERAALEAIPEDPAESPAALGFAAPEGRWRRRVEAITYPSLNVRGLRSAWTGPAARTVIPDAAVAELDLRLVADIPPRRQIQRVVEHIRRQGYHVVEEDPDAETRARYPRIAKVVAPEEGYPAARTSMDLPLSRQVRRRLRAAFGIEPVAFPTSGGSIPLYAFTDILAAPTVGVPTVNHDNNQHSPNENLRLGHLWEGIEILAVMLTLG